MATYAQEILELYPWFADTITGTPAFYITSGQAHYGCFYQGGTQGNGCEWGANIRAGTYTLTDLCHGGGDFGIVSISNNGGGTLGTIDKYLAAANSRLTATGMALTPGDLATTLATKNASSSGYYSFSTYSRLVRTGA